eukprot:CAMPEP_0168516690 /NCGR_PEP_ID=MMETSP0405-20121227/5562_1 /TAXON_ID=498012 /ORGANISM="Trichosphaerium sp, Strain Am-I-7 wt" /LENGTH=665 /DNA_ID=CAMNT_0008536469 /DNA_START=161 /DNA_END=2155 /DNA_ORIENTATION=+
MRDDLNFKLTAIELWDVRLYGLGAEVILMIMAIIGVGWVIKVQLGLLVVLVLAIFSIMIGSFLFTTPDTGFVGWGNNQFTTNFGSGYTDGESFFSVFAVFFPAVTGILAGVNISGDLKDPATNIPTGTLSAIGVSTVGYIVLAFFAGISVEREVSPGRGGLINDFLIFREVSLWGPLILIGIFAATLSSALASLVGAPRIFQAVCKDKLFPKPFKVFAAGRGALDEPIRGYFLTFVIASLCVLIGDLNLIAPIISMFFMITYALINFACFAASMVETPGWRPRFSFYNPWVSLLGAALCIAAMFLISWWNALIAIIVGGLLYLYIWKKKPDVSWGPAGDAFLTSQTIQNLYSLRKKKSHVKNYRPHYLIMTGPIKEHVELMEFSRFLTKGKGLNLFINVTLGDYSDDKKKFLKERGDGYLASKSIKGFRDVVVAPSFRAGALSAMQNGGLGSLRPNALVLGWKYNWRKASKQERDEYADVVRDAFGLNMSVIIPKVKEMDFTVKQKKGRIDVWWLIADGGFTVFVPYLMAQKKWFAGSKLRVIIVPNDSAQISKELLSMTLLLKKMRIDCEVEPVSVDASREQDAKMRAYIKKKKLKFDPKQKERTIRYWRLSQLLQEHSSDASMVFCTIPFPRATIPSRTWLGWISMLSEQLPPIVFLRGNQEN